MTIPETELTKRIEFSGILSFPVDVQTAVTAVGTDAVSSVAWVSSKKTFPSESVSSTPDLRTVSVSAVTVTVITAAVASFLVMP